MMTCHRKPNQIKLEFLLLLFALQAANTVGLLINGHCFGVSSFIKVFEGKYMRIMYVRALIGICHGELFIRRLRFDCKNIILKVIDQGFQLGCLLWIQWITVTDNHN